MVVKKIKIFTLLIGIFSSLQAHSSTNTFDLNIEKIVDDEATKGKNFAISNLNNKHILSYLSLLFEADNVTESYEMLGLSLETLTNFKNGTTSIQKIEKSVPETCNKNFKMELKNLILISNALEKVYPEIFSGETFHYVDFNKRKEVLEISQKHGFQILQENDMNHLTRIITLGKLDIAFSWHPEIKTKNTHNQGVFNDLSGHQSFTAQSEKGGIFALKDSEKKLVALATGNEDIYMIFKQMNKKK